MTKFKSRLLIFALTLTAAVCLFAFAGCSSDLVRLDTTGKVAVTYDPLGGIWATGLSPEPRTFYASEGSILPSCYEKGAELQNSFPSVRHNGYTLLGWYKSYEDETFQPDALGSFVKYAFTEDAAGTYKLERLYVEDPDGNFVALFGEEDAYESFEELTVSSPSPAT